MSHTFCLVSHGDTHCDYLLREKNHHSCQGPNSGFFLKQREGNGRDEDGERDRGESIPATIDITEYNVPVKFYITRRLQQLNL